VTQEQSGDGAKEQEQGKGIQLRDPSNTTGFANFFTIMGAEDSILISFGSIFGGQEVAQLDAKIAMSPRNAKRLALSLGSVIRRYEEQHGEIDVGAPPQQQGGAPPAAGS
jgi:hypothetical protein